MAYKKTLWKDRVVEKPNTYRSVENPDGTITLYPITGQVIEKGTPISAANLNKIEDGIVELGEQLDTIETEKISKNESNVISEEMCTQSLREKFTSGSVAVVGNGCVDVNNLASNLQEDVAVYNLLILSIINGTHYRDVDGVATANTSSNLYHSAISNCTSGDVFKVYTKTQSKNQIGVLFVDDAMNIKGKFLIGTGTLQSFEDYKVVAPPLSSKIIVSVYNDKSFLKLKKLNYAGIANKIYVDNKFKGREKMNLSWEMNGIGTNGQNNTIVTRIRTVDYYNFDENIVITPDAGYKYAIFIYDENKSFLTYEWFNETKEIIIDKKYFYRFCIANTNDTTANLSYKDNIKIERYYQLPSLNELINSRIPNRWYGKKLIIIGDSISDDNYNSALSFVWTKGVRDYFGFGSYENYAIASSTIAVKESDPTNRTPLVTRYQEMSNDGDLIIVSAVTNDWFYQWTPIGTMESRDIYSFYGALHTLCIRLKKKYKGKTIIFLNGIMRRQADRQTPNAVNGLGKSLIDYNNILKEVCSYYSLPVIDMNGECGLYPFDDELAEYYFNKQTNVNGVYYTHPNVNGQKMMFDVLVNKI